MTPATTHWATFTDWPPAANDEFGPDFDFTITFMPQPDALKQNGLLMARERPTLSIVRNEP